MSKFRPRVTTLMLLVVIAALASALLIQLGRAKIRGAMLEDRCSQMSQDYRSMWLQTRVLVRSIYDRHTIEDLQTEAKQLDVQLDILSKKYPGKLVY